MDLRVLFCFAVLFISFVLCHRQSKEETSNDSYYDEDYDYNYGDEEPDKEKPMKSIDPTNIPIVTTLKAATYEVTENVEDIPNTSTRFGPVIVNYTTARPLNNASFVNRVKNITSPYVTNYGFINEANNKDKEITKAKKNYLSIFHVKAEFDDKPNIPQNSGDIDNIQHQSGFKEYILGLKKGIINGLSRIFRRKSYENEDNTHEFQAADHETDVHKFQHASSGAAYRLDHEHHLDNEDEFD